MCIAHWGHEPARWSSVTARTIELEWFATFIHDVQRMANFPRKGEQPWHAYAAQFWVNTDPTMGPQPEEMRRGAPVYLYRLLGELRAMALGKDRPGLHQPQADWPSFQPTGTSASGAAPVVVAVSVPAPLPSPVNAAPMPAAARNVEPPPWVLDDVPPPDALSFSDPNHAEAA